MDGPDRPKLLEAVVDADAILVRSATTVDAEVLDAGKKLKIIARAASASTMSTCRPPPSAA